LFSYHETSCVKPQHKWELTSRSSWNTGMHSGLSNKEKLWSEVTLVTVDWADDLLPCKKGKKKRIHLWNMWENAKNHCAQLQLHVASSQAYHLNISIGLKIPTGGRQTSWTFASIVIRFYKWLDNVNWPPLIDWKADVSSVSPSSERIEELWVVCGLCTERWSYAIGWCLVTWENNRLNQLQAWLRSCTRVYDAWRNNSRLLVRAGIEPATSEFQDRKPNHTTTLPPMKH